jgi:trk system potassium uptake protein
MAAPDSPKRICIMGCGRVGAQLAQHFAAQQYDVCVIDMQNDAFRRLPDDGKQMRTFLGDGTDPTVLEGAGIKGAAMFIAVTNGDNRNIMAAQVAQHLFQVPQVICRIYDPKRHEIYKGLGIHSICPTLIGADAIYFDLMGAHLVVDAAIDGVVEHQHSIQEQHQ